MKIRTDFVTNSSSSSFIIATNQEIPEKYIEVCKKISKENFYEYFKEKYEYNTISYGNDEKLKEIAGLTDEQMLLIKIAIDGELDEYLEMKKKVEQSETPVYNIYEDRDWLYNQYDLTKLIENSEIISHETDL